MAIDPGDLKTWLFGQLALGLVYLVKELWRIYRDQSHKNTEDIGKIKVQNAKQSQDLNAAWERIRMLERSMREAAERKTDS